MKDYKRMTVGEIVADNLTMPGYLTNTALTSAATASYCFLKPARLPELTWRK